MLARAWQVPLLPEESGQPGQVVQSRTPASVPFSVAQPDAAQAIFICGDHFKNPALLALSSQEAVKMEKKIR